jgi:thiamine kinase-like enzyme
MLPDVAAREVAAALEQQPRPQELRPTYKLLPLFDQALGVRQHCLDVGGTEPGECLEWAGLDADPRVVRLWEHRYELHERLEQLPLVLSHGDYSIGNLVAQGTDTVALDWATFGWEAVGFDLAHLALSTGEDPTGAYLAATPLAHPAELVTFGFQTALVIIGASRLHWMVSQGLDVPAWYAQFCMTMIHAESGAELASYRRQEVDQPVGRRVGTARIATTPKWSLAQTPSIGSSKAR